jgi:RIO kinase 1
VSSTAPQRSDLEWPEHEPYEDVPLGNLKSGKEAEIFLVERRYASGPRLLAHKRYRPRRPAKGQLREEGFSNSTAYRADSVYRGTWAFLNARDQRAVSAGNKSGYGQELAGELWPALEWLWLRRAWDSGASVPYPVEQTDHGLLMEYIGDESMAAPKLAQARLEPDALTSAWAQLQASLRALTEAGLVHADLSAYNLLWWDGRLVMIDLPQAVEFTTNAEAWDLLHRDVANVGDWFTRHGYPVDVEETYVDLLTLVR